MTERAGSGSPAGKGVAPEWAAGARVQSAVDGRKPLAAAGVFWLGWRIDVPVLSWVLMIVGGFFLAVLVFLLGILLFGPGDETASSPRRHRGG